MTASGLFSMFNTLALLGWICLCAGVVLRRPWLRDGLAGTYIPVVMSAAYLVLMLFFFGRAEGGFDTLLNVQKLFASPWVALAGWIHYLAFDLFIGAGIARSLAERQLPRWPLVILLPLTFLFGPVGFLGHQILLAIVRRKEQRP